MHFFAFAAAGLAGVAVARDTHYKHAVSHIRRERSAAIVAREEPMAGVAQPAGNSSCTPYWMEHINHQGVAAFNKNSTMAHMNYQNGTYGTTGYQVFRNVKDYGAVGDGVTDDTAAIQKAIADGGRCAPGVCMSRTDTPAVVYFPEGVYSISASIIDYYYTQIIGNPNCLPTIRATASFNTTTSLGLIDGSPYGSNGKTGFGPTNTFFRQIRNLILDTTLIPAELPATGVHWPTAQTTSLQNVVFNMAAGNGTKHQGLFVEEGSGGFMTDLIFNGGNYGFNVGNQQFTTRNLTFNGCVTAINQLWAWGWTYKSVSINNCQVGFNLSAGGPDAVGVGSVTILDSSIKNTPIGIISARTAKSFPDSAGAIYLENVELENVQTAITGYVGLNSTANNSTILAGSSTSSKIAAWADGHRYLSEGLVETQGTLEATKRPANLLDASGKYYERSKPQYEGEPLDRFLSTRTLGAKGDGKADDTAALNAAILQAKKEDKILYVDAGYYMVSSTIYIPAGSKIVGEALSSVILSSGPYFNDIANPKPVVQVGKQGEQGCLEWSDMFVSTQGTQAGAILIEYNLYAPNEPAGLWDVHARIGGFAGSGLQNEQCPKTPGAKVTADTLNKKCLAAYMTMHVTKWASNLYMENNWFWVADHDLDDTLNNNTQITLYAGRGLLVESLQGKLWLYGTAVEHHVKYEYQFVDTKDVFMGQVQTETAYYQPNPDASLPFPEDAARFDPVFTSNTPSLPSNSTPSWNSTMSSNNATTPSVPNSEGWALRILRSSSIHGYGVGLYSFFNNYNTSCSDITSEGICQTRIFSVEGDGLSHDINIYNLNTVGSVNMVTRDGMDLVKNVDNNSTFVDGLNVLRF